MGVNGGFVNGHALLVGVGADLPVTVADATALRDLLVDPKRGAYPPEQVCLLSGPAAHRTRILTELDRLAERVGDGSDAVALVYFSGHGGRFATGETWSYHLVPFGFDPTDRASTGISDVEFTAKLEAVEAQRLIVFLDCCFAGGMPVMKAAGAEADFQPSALPPELLRRLDSGSGRVVVSSSRENEYSYVAGSHSVFTRVLLDALAGHGAASQDSFARVLNVLAYLFEEVPRKLDNGLAQHPFVNKIVDLNDNFPVCYYAGGAKALPAGFAKELPPQPDDFRRETLEIQRNGLREAARRYQTTISSVEQELPLETNLLSKAMTEQALLRERARLAQVQEELAAVEAELG